MSTRLREPALSLPSVPAPSAVVALLAVGLLVAPLVAISPPLVVLAALGVLLVVVVMVHPPVAAYILIGTTPLLVGIDRGAIMPMLRPNEAVIILLGSALLARRFIQLLAGRPVQLAPTAVDLSLLLLVIASSLLPLAWMAARGIAITRDDLLYAVVLWKYYGIFLIVKHSITTNEQIRRCLLLSVGVGTIVALIGILQALNLLNVPNLLASHYAPMGDAGALDENRASATIAHPQGFGDLMIFNFAIVVGYVIRERPRRRLLFGAAVLFAIATLASGQFSELLGLLTAVGALGLITGQLRRILLALLPVFLLAPIALQPVIEARGHDVDRETGAPISWTGRWENLERYFLPKLEAGGFVLGVQLAARVRAPDVPKTSNEWVYIESGHAWLLWTGGIPLFLAFFVFLWRSIRATARVARTRPGSSGVAAIASFTALTVLAVVTTFDPHLTIRGSADLNFMLLALALAPLVLSAEEREQGGSRLPPLRV